MNSSRLDELRHEIDAVDEQLVELFNRRARAWRWMSLK